MKKYIYNVFLIAFKWNGFLSRAKDHVIIKIEKTKRSLYFSKVFLIYN